MRPFPAIRAHHGSDWRAMAEPIVRHAGWFGFFLVLAPIIGPRGYGSFATALSGIAIVETLLIECVATALSRLEPHDDRYLSTALVSAVGAGAIISLLLYMAGEQLGLMLDEASVGDIARTLSLLPVLGGLAAVPITLLRRRGKAGPFAAATTAGLASGGGAAIALAWTGAGPWSLVAQIVVQRFVECAVVWGIAGRRIGLTWSATHFVELLEALELSALARAWPVVVRQTTCLLIGLILGPIATGLYVLASRVAEALEDILLTPAGPARRALLADWAREIRKPFQRISLPVALSCLFLPVALPPIVDIRWWGAVLPAQILVLRLIPAAAISARIAAVGVTREARWRAIETIGSIAAVALATPYGLAAIATASVVYAACVGLAGLWPIRREFGASWHRALAGTARPFVAAAATGLILYPFIEPLALTLPPALALCLLGAVAHLCYLLVDRGIPWRKLPPLFPRHELPPVKPA